MATQDEAAAKVHSDFLRGDFEGLLKPSDIPEGTAAAATETDPELFDTRLPVSKPTAVQPRKWQPIMESGTQSEGATFNRFSPEEPGSLYASSDVMDSLEYDRSERRMSHPSLQLARRKRLAKRRRRLLSRSQDGMDHDSAFTRSDSHSFSCWPTAMNSGSSVSPFPER